MEKRVLNQSSESFLEKGRNVAPATCPDLAGHAGTNKRRLYVEMCEEINRKKGAAGG